MHRLILSILLAVALAGCGDDKGSEATGRSAGGAKTGTTTTAAKPAVPDAPHPAEPAELEVVRLAKAARADDCSSPEELFVDAKGPGPHPCHRLLRSIAPKLPPEVSTYGSGAVVTNANGGHSILALDSDRRFKFAVAFTGRDLPEAPVKVADESMAQAVGAIRRDNCHDILRWAYSGVKRYCKSEEIRQLHAALDRAYTASPTALGGDGSFAFYGLRVKPHYFTLVFLASPNGSYFFVTSVRA